MDQQQLARSMGWFSIGLGLVEVVAPRRMADSLGLGGRERMVQMCGLREIGVGVGLLMDESRRPGWAWGRVAGDALDLALLASANPYDERTRKNVAAARAAVIGTTAMDVMVARRLSSNGANGADGAVHVEEAITIDRSPEELYSFWRGFERLPKFMKHLVSVQQMGRGISHWVAKGPAGTTVEWDSQVTEDRPNELIAWRSVEGADVDNAGVVRFEPARGKRGTVVRVQMDYRPPGGKVGATVAKLLGEAPEKQIPVDLRRFKQLMETGEIPTTEGQPSGRRSSTSLYDRWVQQ